MAKRMTDTEKWRDDWFVGLSPESKLLWVYVVDNCDHAGIWRVSEQVASALVGLKFDIAKCRAELGARVVEVGRDYWFIPGFLRFQYGASVNLKAGVVISARRRLAEFGLEGYLDSPDTLPTPSHEGPGTPKDKDKDKDKDSTKRILKEALDAPRAVPSPTSTPGAKKSVLGASVARFEAFYALYPRHVGKDAGLKAWLKLSEAEQDLAASAVVWQAKSPDHLKASEPKYVPHCATWLNQRRFTDPRPSSGGGGVDYSKLRV